MPKNAIHDEFVDSWSDMTKNKCCSNYLTILRQSGLLNEKTNELTAIKLDASKRVRDAAFFFIIMLVTFAATLLKPQKYVSSRTIQKCVEHVSTST